MTRRAEATAETRAAILAATLEIGDPRAPLSAIAARAGISERTVLRHFGSRDGLVAAAIGAGTEQVEQERFDLPVGDLGAAVANLVDHYEEAGDRVIRLLGEEGADETIDAILAEGRRLHRRWVREKLGPLLGERSAGERRLRIAQLVAVCDVYTWKLLRRDSGLSRAATERAIAELIGAVIDLESEDR